MNLLDDEEVAALHMELTVLGGSDPRSIAVLAVAIRISLGITQASPEDRAAIGDTWIPG